MNKPISGLPARTSIQTAPTNLMEVTVGEVGNYISTKTTIAELITQILGDINNLKILSCLNIGDPDVTGSWRLCIDGTNLKLEQFDGTNWNLFLNCINTSI